jgi:transcriptional regulator with XRE-family HTH domain
MTIGQKIKEIRELKGMTLEGVANLTGISRQRVQAIESSTGYPMISTIQKIAKALGCPLRDILNEPLELYLDAPAKTDDTDYPCANAEKCPFFKKKINL